MRSIWQALGWLTAIALASLVPAFAFWFKIEDPTSWSVVVLAHLSVRTAVIFVLPLVVIIGLPLMLICRRFRWMGPIAAAVVGLLVGAAGILIWGPFLGDRPRDSGLSAGLIESVIRSGISGAFGGLAFWATLRFWPKVAFKS